MSSNPFLSDFCAEFDKKHDFIKVLLVVKALAGCKMVFLCGIMLDFQNKAQEIQKEVVRKGLQPAAAAESLYYTEWIVCILHV